MNPFSADTSDILIPEKKRSFKRVMNSNEAGIYRKNLLSEFDETPTKVLKLLPSGRSYTLETSSSFSTKKENEACEKMKLELRQKEADIVTLKAKITRWEQQMAKLESDFKEAQINHDKEVGKIKAICDREVVKSSELQSKLQYLMKKEKLARDEVEEVKKEYEKQKVETDRQILQIQRLKLQEGDKAQQLRSTWLEKEADLREELMSLKSENCMLKIKCEEAEAHLALRKRNHAENDNHSTQVQTLEEELRAERDKNKELSKKISDHEDNMVITGALKSDLDLVPSMKKELQNLRLDNEQLRHNEQNTLLLEEELRSVKRKLQEALATAERFTELEVINEDLQARLQRWEAKDTSGSRRPQSPSSLSRKVNELEMSQAMMLMKQGDTESSLKMEMMKLEQLESEKNELLLSLASEKTKVMQQNDLIKRLKRKVLLLSKERDSFKNVLDSYESEVTINIDAQNQYRIRQMEDILKGYQTQSDQTETQIVELEEKLAASQIAYDKVQQQLQLFQSGKGVNQTGTRAQQQDDDAMRQLKEQVATMENSLLKVQEERDILEARLEQKQLQGDYDPSKTKILHLENNPCSDAQEVRKELVKKLTTENDALRKRNEILETNDGRIEDLTIQVNEKLQQPSPTKELEAMKQEVKRHEIKNKRLMEIYTKTSKEFREICYQLMGYKIDIPCTNQYRLTNMYSSSDNEYLWFQQNEQGEIQMLETDFSNSLKDMMELYLQRHNSIPLFLSQVTRDLYSRQTMILE